MSYVSDKGLYARRYAEGASLRVEPATMHTGNPEAPTTPGLALIAHDFRVLGCFTLEHAHRLHDEIGNLLNGETT